MLFNGRNHVMMCLSYKRPTFCLRILVLPPKLEKRLKIFKNCILIVCIHMCMCSCGIQRLTSSVTL